MSRSPDFSVQTFAARSPLPRGMESFSLFPSAVQVTFCWATKGLAAEAQSIVTREKMAAMRMAKCADFIGGLSILLTRDRTAHPRTWFDIPRRSCRTYGESERDIL